MISQEAIEKVLSFRDQRNWKQFHNPKDLAISLNLEAAELLECFQWSGAELYCPEKKAEIAEELADVLAYTILMADACGLDLETILNGKMEKNAQKYPVNKAFGTSKKYNQL